MGNVDRILDLVRALPGSTDGELRRLSGIEPHQQINQICRRLERMGLLRRVLRYDGLIGNHPAAAVEEHAPEPNVELEVDDVPYLPFGRGRAVPPGALIVIPCSARKIPGGGRFVDEPGITDLLPRELSSRLDVARRRLAERAELDESRLLSAWERYAGTFYRSAGGSLRRRIERGEPVVVLSGAYGLLLAQEGIGSYDRRFSPSDWPRGLLEACLAEVALIFERTTILSLCGRTTSYADLVRRCSRLHGIETVLAGVDLGGRGGAQVLVPRVAGEALGAYDDGLLMDGWRSGDGIAVELEWLTRDD